MIRLFELKLPLSALPLPTLQSDQDGANTDAPAASIEHPIEALQQLSAQRLGIELAQISQVRVFKRSFDARKAELLAVFIVDVYLHDAALCEQLLARFQTEPHIAATPDMVYRLAHHAPNGWVVRPVVVGFGPCGMFAALLLAQMGLRPIVLERGREVSRRTRDTWNLWRKQVLQAESNVQFGEGGAGMFSDGKLYSQIKDPRYLGRQVMTEFVNFGAPKQILFDAHPHIGTFRLAKVVQNLRQRIIELGGEIRFEQRLTDILLTDAKQRRICGLKVLDQASGQSYELPANQVILALGHSARDSFAMLHQRGVTMQAKPFSIGLRIEHPQSLIDGALWGRHAGNPVLGAAAYKLVHHARNGRAVYSFCMCSGGTVVAATSEVGRVVTNGMSQYSRNERNANAGLVVALEPSDYPQDGAAFARAFDSDSAASYANEALALQAVQPQAVHPLAGINLQRALESDAFVLGGGNYAAPVQLVADFMQARPSSSFGSVQPSYQPGVKLANLHSILPSYVSGALLEALAAFDKKIKGFAMPDAVLTGVETRTSAPLRIPRGENFQSINTAGLYPGGEGAGYAGGILSAAVDGIRLAEALALQFATG